MTLEQFKNIWKVIQTEIAAKEKYFSELDAATGGDGDHGTAIVAAMNAIVNAEGSEFKQYIINLAERLSTESSGSTSTLYGSWFEGMADALPEGVSELTPIQVATMFQGGLDEIMFATKARVGDKTMMDTLIPATEALVKAIEAGATEKDAFSAAAHVAELGSASTAALQAKFGRARNLGERSIGAIDAGSASMALIFGIFGLFAK